jgi:spectinomycin phosphotransferase
VIFGARGEVHLVDWDTVRIGPRERDLWMVLDDDRTGWDEYVAEAGPVLLRPEVVALYLEWWSLAEVAIYVTQFRVSHDESEDTLVAWESLNKFLP